MAILEYAKYNLPDAREIALSEMGKGEPNIDARGLLFRKTMNYLNSQSNLGPTDRVRSGSGLRVRQNSVPASSASSGTISRTAYPTTHLR
jgi:hypothetical protein